jgi:hypothetical protein
MNRSPAPESSLDYRQQCLAYQRGACSGLPVCEQCGTVEQALRLAGWVKHTWQTRLVRYKPGKPSP